MVLKVLIKNSEYLKALLSIQLNPKTRIPPVAIVHYDPLPYKRLTMIINVSEQFKGKSLKLK
jgi:hypothetical protein